MVRSFVQEVIKTLEDHIRGKTSVLISGSGKEIGDYMAVAAEIRAYMQVIDLLREELKRLDKHG